MSVPSIWTILGIAPTTDVSLIRRAYASALKRANPDDDAQGFAFLRQAYERALVQARSVSAVPTAVEQPSDTATALRHQPSTGQQSTVADTPPTVTVTAEAPPISAPTDLEQLRSAFTLLQQAAAERDSPAAQRLQALLEACLRSKALENLSVQLEFEAAMVLFLHRNLPRTEPLLETVIARWQWRDRGRLKPRGEIAVLLARADTIRYLENVSASSPRAYQALTNPPRPVWLWMQILFFRLDKSVREVLERFQGSVPGVVNPQALAWWGAFHTRPHLRPQLIQASWVLALTGVICGAKAGFGDDRALGYAAAGGLAGALVGGVIAASWWGLIDWPRYRLAAVRRGGALWLRIGWVPATLSFCIVIAACPDTPLMTLATILLCLPLLSWAIVMHPDIDGTVRHLISTRARGAFFTNLPIVIWWGLAAADPVNAPTGPMWVVFIAALLAFAIGQPLLWALFLRGRSVGARQRARVVLGSVCVATLAVLVFAQIDREWAGVVLTEVLAIVLIHRTAAGNLTAGQIRIRHLVTFFPAIIGAQLISHGPLQIGLGLGGILLMAGVAVSMAVCLFNDWKLHRQSAPSAA